MVFSVTMNDSMDCNWVASQMFVVVEYSFYCDMCTVHTWFLKKSGVADKWLKLANI